MTENRRPTHCAMTKFQIENDEIKLETALEQYQKGMLLVKFCQDKLAQVEQKVKLLDMETDSLKDFATE